MSIVPSIVATGQRWTFVHAAGARAEYRVDSAEGEDPQKGEQRPASLVRLENMSTGRFAHVTVHWLRGGRNSLLGRWVFDSAAEEAEAA